MRNSQIIIPGNQDVDTIGEGALHALSIIFSMLFSLITSLSITKYVLFLRLFKRIVRISAAFILVRILCNLIYVNCAATNFQILHTGPDYMICVPTPLITVSWKSNYVKIRAEKDYFSEIFYAFQPSKQNIPLVIGLESDSLVVTEEFLRNLASEIFFPTCHHLKNIFSN